MFEFLSVIERQLFERTILIRYDELLFLGPVGDMHHLEVPKEE